MDFLPIIPRINDVACLQFDFLAISQIKCLHAWNLYVKLLFSTTLDFADDPSSMLKTISGRLQ